MKRIFILITILFFFHNAHAQRDTAIYCMMNNGQLAANKYTADYFLFVMPSDSSSGKELYPVKDYYSSGIIKLLGNSSINKYSNRINDYHSNRTAS